MSSFLFLVKRGAREEGAKLVEVVGLWVMECFSIW